MIKIKKGITLFMTALLIMGSMSIAAFAEVVEKTPNDPYYIQKVWEDTSAPTASDVATFEFKPYSFKSATEGVGGATGNAVPGPATFTFEVKGDAASALDGESNKYSSSTDIHVELFKKFSDYSGLKDGEYNYVLSESSVVPANKWTEKTPAKYNVTFTVANGSVTKVKTQLQGDEEKIDTSQEKDGVVFRNTNETNIKDARLVITKNVMNEEGAADANQEFTFTLKDFPSGANYTLRIYDGSVGVKTANDCKEVIMVKKGDSFRLKANQFAVINSISKDDKVTVYETPAGGSFTETYAKAVNDSYDYLTTKTGTKTETMSIVVSKKNGKTIEEDATVGDAIHFNNVYNEKGQVDAGLNINIYPFLIMMAIALILIIGYSAVRAQARKQN